VKKKYFLISGVVSLWLLTSCAAFDPNRLDEKPEKKAHANDIQLKKVQDPIIRDSGDALQQVDNLRSDLEKISKPKVKIKPVMPVYDPLDHIRVTLDMDNEDVQFILQALAKEAHFNLLVHPNLASGKNPRRLTIHFNRAPASVVLREILKTADIAGRREGNLLIVEPFEERIFQLNYLETDYTNNFSAGGDVLSSSGQSTGLTGTFSMSGSAAPTSNAYDELENMLTRLLGRNRNNNRSQQQIQQANDTAKIAKQSQLASAKYAAKQLFNLNRSTGTLFVRARPSVMKAVVKLERQYRQVLGRQIIIEAQFLEVALNDGLEHGINWTYLANSLVGNYGGEQNVSAIKGLVTDTGVSGLSGQRGLLIPAQQLALAAGGASTLGLTYAAKEFTTSVKLLQQFGKVSILSNPTIRAKHAKPALISVGLSNTYVQKIETTITTASGSTPIIKTTATTTSVFDGLVLGLVPFIDKDDNISLAINPVQSKVSPGTLSLQDVGGGVQVSLPQVKLKAMNTVLKMHNRDVILLGGLISKEKSNSTSGIPILSTIPYLGNLFKTKAKSTKNSELVIVIRVTIV